MVQHVFQVVRAIDEREVPGRKGQKKEVPGTEKRLSCIYAPEIGSCRLYFFLVTNDREMPADQVVLKAGGRCDRENMVAQLKGGVHALATPSGVTVLSGRCPGRVLGFEKEVSAQPSREFEIPEREGVAMIVQLPWHTTVALIRSPVEMCALPLGSKLNPAEAPQG